MSAKLRIVFFGTPHFAVAILAGIIEAGHDVVYAVTAPDKPAGRGRQLKMSAVKEFALAQQLQVLQPDKLRDEDFLSQLKAADADVFVVVAFRMLPEAVWRLPRLGTFNLHASLLPQYRGAAPINWAIINGEDKTGVTTFFINEEIDTGAILLQEEVPIAPNENAGSLHDKLMQTGTELVVKTLDGLGANTLKAHVQPMEGSYKKAPKIFKEDCKIDWQLPGLSIDRLIRGMSPYPGTFTLIHEGELKGVLKIGAATFFSEQPKYPAGYMWVASKHLYIQATDGVFEVQKLQPEGKRMMSSKDFINGLRNENQAFILK
jgi:methionyl-tRNA formyltransferase